MKLQKSLETCFSDVHTMKLLSANNYVLRIFTNFFPIAHDIVYKSFRKPFESWRNDIEVHFTRSFQNFMTLPVEKMKLSDKELNCMKMCQKAPKCADFSINPGEACPRPPYPRLAPTELAFMHSVNQNTHINSQTRCYDPEYRLELFSVCESVPSS